MDQGYYKDVHASSFMETGNAGVALLRIHWASISSFLLSLCFFSSRAVDRRIYLTS